MPLLEAEASGFDQFRFQRPASVTTIEDIDRNLGSLFLMIDPALTFAVRGQIIPCTDHPHVAYLFCGSPWMFWLSNNRPDLKLGLNDFSAQDAQVDQLFYINTESRMVEDLERLNAELTRAKAETEEAQASRDRFFARMSHEMRTPLNGVISAITLLQDHSHREEVADLLRLAGQSATNLLQVINYVLDVSKLESQDGALEPVSFNVADLIDSVLDVVRARAMEKSLTLDFDLGDGVLSHYVGDANLLRQVLLNLAMNAIKFTEEGGVHISVELSEQKDYTLRFEVRDTGIGIRKEVQKTIFEPFSTLHNNIPGTMGEGTGLGLDIVRRNTRAMDGVIGVSSAPGAGTTFWLELPLKESDEESAPPPRERKSRPDEEDHLFQLTGKVLLVDDNETNLMLGAMLIEGMGLAVDQANGGQAAIDLALSSDYDAVLMDISMPEVDGYKATEAIREVKDKAELPILALSAHASQVERDRSQAVGMNGYLTKPIERDKLFAALARILIRARANSDIGEDPTAKADTQIDCSVLKGLRESIGTEYLKQVTDKLFIEAPGRFEALYQATKNEEVALQAHALAGMCSSFGLIELTGLLKEMETAARAGTAPRASDINAVTNAQKTGFSELSHWLESQD